MMIDDSDDKNYCIPSNIADECALYESLVTTHPIKVDPLTFWQGNKDQLPTLAKVAQKVYGFLVNAIYIFFLNNYVSLHSSI